MPQKIKILVPPNGSVVYVPGQVRDQNGEVLPNKKVVTKIDTSNQIIDIVVEDIE